MWIGIELEIHFCQFNETYDALLRLRKKRKSIETNCFEIIENYFEDRKRNNTHAFILAD